MATDLSIQLSEHTFSVLSMEAAAVGKTPGELAADVVEGIYSRNQIVSPDAEAARKRFEACFGSIDLGHPIGIENDAIDADLGRAYGNSG